MSVVLFLLVLFVLVLVHEWGHFIAAKKTGMRVDEFGIGFPPKLFGVQKGETEYTFNLLPIGGFVRIFGENKEDGIDFTVSEDDKKRAFSARPKWAQAVVLVAGVTMNVLFAWLLFTITFLYGVQTPVETETASENAQLYVVQTLPDAPADGVLPTGAKILEIENDTEKLSDPNPENFSAFIAGTAPDSVSVTYEFDGQTDTVEITPQSGISESNPDAYIIGVSLSLVEVVRYSVFDAITQGFTTTMYGLKAISVGLWGLLHDAIFGEADFSAVAGPVGIVGMVGDAAAFGIVALLTFTAIISLNLAIINLLPFPALDGGRLLFVIIETITRREIPSVWTGRLNAIGFILLLALMVAVTYNDIMRIL